MSAQIQKVSKQIKKMNTVSDRANTGFKRMEKSAKATAATISKDFKKAYEDAKPDNFFKGVKTAGTTLTAMGVAGAGVLALATKSAISFESAFAGVRKTVDASEEEFAQFKQQIRSMAKVIPATHEEIASVAEAAGQLGIQKEAIMGFTRTMIDLGVATNMTSDEAATALARFANITQMSANDYDRLGSTIVGLGNNLATTESEIVEMGLRLAGAGAQIGMSEAQILALSGALSSVGIAAEAGGSAISKLMIDMASEVATNGKNLANFAKVSGMTSQQFKTAFKDDAGGALVTFIEGLGRMSKEGENVFGILDKMGLSEIRLRDALLRASGAGDLFRESMELGTAAWTENTALTDEARERYKTTESQLKVLKNIIRDVGVTLGDVFLPHVITASKTIGNLAERVNNLSPKTKKMIAIMLMATTAFALIGGPLLLLIALLPSIAAGFAMIGTVALPVGIATLAIGALVAAGLYLRKNWGNIKKRADELKTKLIDLKNKSIDKVKDGITAVKDKFKEWQPVIENTAKILGVIFGPALIKTGIEAVIAGGRIALNFIGSLAKAGTAAVINAAKITVNFIASLIRTGVQASATALVITGKFIVSLVRTGVQAAATALIITGQLVAAMLRYALSGWRVVASIAAVSLAWVAQKAVLIASTLLTWGMVAAQWALNAAMWAAPYMWIVAAILAVVAVGVLLYKNWDTIKAKAGELWVNLTEKFSGIKEGVVSSINGAKEGFLSALRGMKSGAVSIVNSIIGVFNGMISGLNGMQINVPEWVPGIGGKELSLNIPKIPNVKSHYHGIDYVPYDGYTARLHKGERVQTAQEAKESRQGGGTSVGDVLVTGNTFHVRQESDIEAIANLLAIKVYRAKEAGA